jgi:hypothetical protein
MDNWKDVAISTVIVLGVSLMLNFSSLPDGYGKLFAYLGIGFLPVLVIQFQKNSKLKKGLETSEFIFALVLNTFLVLFFATIILAFMDKI